MSTISEKGGLLANDYHPSTPPSLPKHTPSLSPSLHITSNPEDSIRTNGVANGSTWIKPQISIEHADDDIGSPTRTEAHLSSISSSSPHEASHSVQCSSEQETQLYLQLHSRTPPYPKTPPASYKFHSPAMVPREEKEEGEEEEDRDETAEGKRGAESDKDFLDVLSANSRCRSLPLGIKMSVSESNRISSNSDETVESEGSPPPQQKRSRVYDLLRPIKRLDSTGSDFSIPESSSSDDASFEGANDDNLRNSPKITSPGVEQEDDIFNDGEALDKKDEADTKLINWSCNVFVPACHQLLTRCSENRTKSAQKKSADVQEDLQSLSNTITFFCSEQQQRLSRAIQLTPVKKKGIIQSVSAQSFSRTIVMTPEVESMGDRSYAVKVLRSASQSLIAPLLAEASKRQGFTPSLHQDIIKALQKIAWKVEACLSFSNPSNSVDIHAKIFDHKHAKNVKEMMIKVMPPAEPKLLKGHFSPAKSEVHTVTEPVTSHPSPLARHRGKTDRLSEVMETNSSMSELRRSVVEAEGDDEVWKEEREGRGGEESARAMKEGGAKREEQRSASVSTSREDELFDNFTSLPRRDRIATEGEADMAFRGLTRQPNFSSSPNIDRDEENSAESVEGEKKPRSRRERYFRPRAFRRTTVSLSRKEVQKLGLTTAKHVDESILDDIRAQKAAEARSRADRERDIESNTNSVERKLAKVSGEREEREDEQDGKVDLLAPEAGAVMNGQSEEDSPQLDQLHLPRFHSKRITEYDRFRSASMSDILDSSTAPKIPISTTPDHEYNAYSPHLRPRGERVPLNDVTSDSKQQTWNSSDDRDILASSPQTVSNNLQKSYVPLRRATGIPAATDSSNEWIVLEGGKPKKVSRNRAKEKLKKSFSNSGKFAHSLIKTARSLRLGSISVKSSQEMVKSRSAADLLDDSIDPVQSQWTSPSVHELSNPPTPTPTASPSPSPKSFPHYDTNTLPVKSSRMNTLARIMRKRAKGPRSQSFGKSDKDKSSPTSLSSWHQPELSASGSFGESIEVVARNAAHPVAVKSELC